MIFLKWMPQIFIYLSFKHVRVLYSQMINKISIKKGWGEETQWVNIFQILITHRTRNAKEIAALTFIL